MTTRLLIATALAGLITPAFAQNNAPASKSVETIVCIRHGEKPHSGLGQLTCRGLNRSLALPDVLLSKYGSPQYIFAPNPAEKSDSDRYYYLRPLATIEPTAVRCGLPIDTEYGYREIAGLEGELETAKYQNATVFVAWEHIYLDTFAQDMMSRHGGDQSTVPAWPEDDFDTIFVIRITRSGGTPSVTFTIDHEGLNGSLKNSCP